MAIKLSFAAYMTQNQMNLRNFHMIDWSLVQVVLVTRTKIVWITVLLQAFQGEV